MNLRTVSKQIQAQRSLELGRLRSKDLKELSDSLHPSVRKPELLDGVFSSMPEVCSDLRASKETSGFRYFYFVNENGHQDLWGGY